jgi:hypothetical protein
MSAQSKIPALLIKTAEKLIQQSVPTIAQIAAKTGIQNIGQPNVELPSACLFNDELQEILKFRNSIVNQINSASKIIETLSKSLDPLTTSVNTAKTSLGIAKTTVTAISTAMLVTPPSIPIPGQLITGLSIAKDLLNGTIPPIITQASNKLNSIKGALDYVNSILSKLVNILKSIDQYLTGCGVSITDSPIINDYAIKINQQYSELENIPSNKEVYQEFTLEIIEEPYSPTVNRRKAVAKNKDNIILLSTPLSFTTNDQTLLNQIKLLIDSNNLKAD